MNQFKRSLTTDRGFRAKDCPRRRLGSSVLGLSSLLLCCVLISGACTPEKVSRPAPASDNASISAATPGGVEKAEQPLVVATPFPSTSPDSNNSPGSAESDTTTSSVKLFEAMNHDEKIDFLTKRAKYVSLLLSGEPYEFDKDMIELLARDYIEPYQRRVGNRQSVIWGDDLNDFFNRAQCYSPDIIRAFRRYNVPVVAGLYIVAVETEFRNIRRSNSAGAAGLFQFIPSTAKLYGVAPRERTDVSIMADAAARYMSNRISEFGTDTMSVQLAIASYNRSPDSVRRDLHEVLSLTGREKARSFWNLVAHSTVLDRNFRGENVKYVPKFIAIAIIGETPWAFGLQIKQALSSCALCDSPCTGVGR